MPVVSSRRLFHGPLTDKAVWIERTNVAKKSTEYGAVGGCYVLAEDSHQ